MSEINKNTLVDKTDLLQFASKYYGVSPERVRMELKQKIYSMATISSDKEPLFFVVSASMCGPSFGLITEFFLDGEKTGLSFWNSTSCYGWFDSFALSNWLSPDDRFLFVGYEFTVV